MVEKTAAFRQRRADDTRRWRERLHRGAAVYPVEVDGTTFDLMERFGVIAIRAHIKNLNPRARRTTQALARAWPVFSSISVARRPCGQSGTVRRWTPAGAQSRRRSALEDPQTSGGG